MAGLRPPAHRMLPPRGRPNFPRCPTRAVVAGTGSGQVPSRPRSPTVARGPLGPPSACAARTPSLPPARPEPGRRFRGHCWGPRGPADCAGVGQYCGVLKLAPKVGCHEATAHFINPGSCPHYRQPPKLGGSYPLRPRVPSLDS